MTGDRRERATTKAGTTSLALACIVVWVIAAASTGPLGIWLAIGGSAVTLGVAVLVFDGPAASRLLQPSPRLVLLGAAAGGVMAAVTYLLYPVLARFAPFIATDTARLYAAFRAPSLLIASVALAPVVLGEELVWRGAVQAALVRRLGLGEASRWRRRRMRSRTPLSAQPSSCLSRSCAGSSGALCAPRRRVSCQLWWLTWCGTYLCCSGSHWTQDEKGRSDDPCPMS
jgi:hypothetical protein